MPGPSATLEREWSLLLAACSASPPEEKLTRIRKLLQQPVQWKALFDLADRHGAQPLLYQTLSGFEDAIPPEAMGSLKQSYQTNLHKALLLSRELIRIVASLTARGIEVMPYKGPALAEIAYGDIALRQAGDIDLLIHPQDLPRIRDVVGELGYRPQLALSDAEERAYLKSGYECAFDGSAGPNLLELQWAIQPRFYAIDFAMNDLFRRAVTVPVAGQGMKTPSPSDLLLVLSAHAAKHVWARLVWLCDIARLMSLPDLDWTRIGSQARDLGVVRILRVTMLAANRLLGAVIPAAAQVNLPEDTAAQVLVEEIQAHIVSEDPYDVESLAYFRLMMRLRERQSDRLRFAQRLVLTPGPGEWQTVRLPRPLFPLYRIVRLSRLAARLVRA
ncbi:MAG TPA: nucleotidyltransferase family protein [Candidatus Sulfotelmatobacter sp.]|nr:nucleotidyltransferase family protein [Candidatus Sulfotelmatobacter sp.]